MTSTVTVELRHNRVTLALHRLREGDGRPLLLLHGLGERTPETALPVFDPWLGPVWGLDFTGHGGSTVPPGGGYTAEILLADADAALAHLESATVVGRGLGAYVALLLAGARPAAVRGAVLADGVGLAGGGTRPGTPAAAVPAEPTGRAPDPFALAELSRDVRPADYATSYLRLALHGSGLDTPIAVSAVVRPEWLSAVADHPGVVELTLAGAVDLFSGLPDG